MRRQWETGGGTQERRGQDEDEWGEAGELPDTAHGGVQGQWGHGRQGWGCGGRGPPHAPRLLSQPDKA